MQLTIFESYLNILKNFKSNVRTTKCGHIGTSICDATHLGHVPPAAWDIVRVE
jgi:hypothetical protein